jgi:hypothetical protein
MAAALPAGRARRYNEIQGAAQMIVFELICIGRHRFEGWFASAEDFDGQKSRGLLVCPVCGDSAIEKLLTARIGKHAAKDKADAARQGALPEPAAPPRPRGLDELVNHILLNTEDVGEEFPAEARRIHYSEAPPRSIHGVATRDETAALIEEGIAVMPLPVPPRGDWH